MGPSERSGGDASRPLSGPARRWSVDEANDRLPDLRELLPELRGWVVRLRQVQSELDRLATFWGAELDSPDHADKPLHDRLTAESATLTAHLEREVASLQSEGIEVKDLDTGLIDFYGTVHGELVFLCWQSGEEEVGFYHPLTGAYRNRRPLPDRPAGARPRPGNAP